MSAARSNRGNESSPEVWRRVAMRIATMLLPGCSCGDSRSRLSSRAELNFLYGQHRQPARDRDGPIRFLFSYYFLLLFAFSQLNVFFRLQIQRRGIHAISQPGGLGTVLKNVAKMSSAICAAGLGATHSIAGIFKFLDLALDRQPCRSWASRFLNRIWLTNRTAVRRSRRNGRSRNRACSSICR